MPFAIMIGPIIIGTIRERDVNALNAVLARELKKRFKVRIVKVSK